MDCTSNRLPYRQTGCFTKIVMDYIDQAAAISPFYTHPPSLAGIKEAIEARKNFNTNRNVLVDELKKQYANVSTSEKVQQNIESLASADTFTITTAHQPNIFTGPLFFIYKILHVIKLAEHFHSLLPSFKFVPVYCMGSEDADLDEIGHTYVDGQKIQWETTQTGAVGRMMVDKELIKLISLVEGQLSVQPFGNEIIALVKECYKENSLIQDATFRFVNALFSEYGLIVVVPDNPALKKQMIPVFEDDLLNGTDSEIVENTSKKLAALYKTQVNPREINLFYLKDGLRERIVKQGTRYLPTGQAGRARGSSFDHSEEELKKELQAHPEYFSPNVILRGLYQETILPNIAFIGGGGEVAYWLQFKDLFANYKVPFPVLILRNSFLVVEKKWQDKISNLGFTIEDFFLPEQELVNRLVARETDNMLRLNGTFTEAERLYENIKKQAVSIDITLEKHVDSLKLQTMNRLQELEKKMLRAEKRKFTDQERQIHTIKEHLFPGNGLQERKENFMSCYAKWGRDFINQLYKHSLGLEQEFVTLVEK